MPSFFVQLPSKSPFLQHLRCAIVYQIQVIINILYCIVYHVTVITLQRSSESVISSGKKSANPALMVPCFQLKNADHEGWMNKLGGSGLIPKNWRRRWFVLNESKLYYYKTSFVSAHHLDSFVKQLLQQMSFWHLLYMVISN